MVVAESYREGEHRNRGLLQQYSRQAFHAIKLDFSIRLVRKRCFIAPIPEDLQALMNALAHDRDMFH